MILGTLGGDGCRNAGHGKGAFCLLLVGVFVFAVLPSQSCPAEDKGDEASEFRLWQSASGKGKVKAKFIEVVDGKVRLKKEDGKVVRVTLTKLSLADQRYIEKRLRDAVTPDVADSGGGRTPL